MQETEEQRKRRLNVFDSILETVGNTPLVRLNKLSPNPEVEIWIKLEMFNPSMAIKDRMVRHIINKAEKSGELKPGGTIIENTSGNTGAAVSMISAVKGYKAILTMPDKVSIEKQNALKAYGSKVVVCPTSAPPDDENHYENVCKKLAKETPNSFRIDQYDNKYNPEAHYLSTGPEIWEQMNGKIDYFVASGSTGGTISGVGRYLKEKNKDIKVVMPDPIGSVYHEYFTTGKVSTNQGCTYLVEGIGEDHICEALDFKVIDEVIQFEDKFAFEICRKLATEEGILAGGSTGANVWGAIQVAKRLKGPARIVTIAPDSGIKYLSKIYNEEWLKEKNLL
eukprot:TRINITY_DN728_c0_g1_i1.p1 TRINITY_DN728_c0_g1~~TRINITY_DN728_c0_g1_i1.p1  ORF type:complete len:337 (-),score=97.29 TRINITY_DN728_c0_g1_i1:47-1057(-)